jgi:hypothetical protein
LLWFRQPEVDGPWYNALEVEVQPRAGRGNLCITPETVNNLFCPEFSLTRLRVTALVEVNGTVSVLFGKDKPKTSIPPIATG